ncbi:toxin [Candidatus Saccharibacteria bacterium]|nr:toxin [Candidatus Saccharibacteria bacterium]
MTFGIRFSEEKNQLLKVVRGVGFDEILESIERGNLLADISHTSQKRARQRLYVVKLGRYAYAVPYVINPQKKEIFLKTVYPSRALTKRYIKGGNNEK